MKVCVPYNSYVEILTCKVMVLGDESFERELGLDGWINALIRDPSLFHHVKLQGKNSLVGSGCSLNTDSDGVMILDFTTSRTVKINYLFFINHPVHVVLL